MLLRSRDYRASTSNSAGPSLMLTPLIDVIFLVLIFFMVNNGPEQRSLGIRTPKMETAEQSLAQPMLLVHLRADLSYVLEHGSRGILSRGQGLSELAEQMRWLGRDNLALAGVKRIRLRADKALAYATVIRACDILNLLNLSLDLDVSGFEDVQ